MAARAGFQTGFEWVSQSDRQFVNNCRAFAEHFPEELREGTAEEAEVLLEDMRLLAALGETGRLRESGRLVFGEGDTPEEQWVRIRFGGEDVGVPYGVVQHEAQDYQHRIGGPWYVTHVMASAQDFFRDRLARRLGWRS